MIVTEKPIKKEDYKAPDGFKATKDESNWWTLTNKNEAASAAWQSCTNLLLMQQSRQLDYYNYALMYGLKSLGYSNTSISTGPSIVAKTTRDAKLRLNAVKCNVDAAQAKIAKNKPRPMFLTTGGNAKQAKRAKGLTQYLDGAFDYAGTYEVSSEVFRNAAVFGLGAMHLYKDTAKGEICNENVWPEEIVVDEVEAQYGNPRQLYRTRLIPRDTLRDRYSNDEEALKLIESAASQVYVTGSGSRDQIQVTEAWYLGNASNNYQGRHVVAIKEGSLFDEVYTKSYFPFVFFRWQPGMRSFFGMGIVEDLFNIQLELNQLCWTVQQSIWYFGIPRIFVNNKSKIDTQHLNNGIGYITKLQGDGVPTFMQGSALSQEIYNWIDYLWGKTFERTGLSELTATSQKPAGVDAAVAMREYQDIETQRFAIVAQSWEKFFIDVAEMWVAETKDLYTELNKVSDEKTPKKELKVKAVKNKFMETINWKDVDLDKDKYVLRCFPTSILPTQPTGRLAFVKELIDGGFIDKELGLSLLDYPDLDRVLSLKDAAADQALATVEAILDDGTYDTPEPYMNLDICIQMAQGALLKSKTDGTSKDKQELLRRFIDDCWVTKQTAPQAQAQAQAQTQQTVQDPQMIQAQ